VVESEVSDVEVCEVVVTETAELQTETLPRELQNLNANWNNLSDHTRATILMLMEADQLTQE